MDSNRQVAGPGIETMSKTVSEVGGDARGPDGGDGVPASAAAATKTTAAASPIAEAELDYRAAMAEIGSNVGVRRLMFVIANVLVPALLMAATDAMSGSNYPPALAWLPEHILGIVGVVTAVGGVLIALVLSRCHVGMVINGAKMSKVIDGSVRHAPLNLLGVTSNFVVLTGLSAGCGSCLAAISFGLVWWIAALLGAGLLLTLIALLAIDHRRAQAKCRQLEAAWTHGPVGAEMRERHATASLNDTTSDIAFVVTMAAALFAGAFNAMTNVGGIPATLELEVRVADLQTHAVPALAGFLFVSLFLSCRMVVRLRIALAQHSATLARLRQEPDDPWRFTPIERTYLLYAIVLLLGGASLVILAWGVAGPMAAWIVGGSWALAGLVWYPIALRLDRQREPTG
jgi:hypothetical protein